jgi:hypothetical protein
MGGEDEMTTPGGAMRLRRAPAMPVLLGALAGLALCGLGYLALNLFTNRQPDTQPTVRAICADLTTQRYDHLYTLLSPTLQTQGSQAQFVASQQEIDALLGPVKACAAGSSSISGSTATIGFSLTRAGSVQPAPAQATLTASGGAWRISAYTGAF